jgi:hypothetical protein
MFVSEGTVQHRTELVNIIWPPVGRQCLSRTFTGPSRPTALSGRELDGRTKGGAVAESMMAIKPERSRRMGGRTTHGLPFAAKDQTRLEDHQSSTGIRGVRSFVLNGGKMARPKRFELLTPRFVVWAGPLKSLSSVTVRKPLLVEICVFRRFLNALRYRKIERLSGAGQ